MEAAFCVETLEGALDHHGKPARLSDSVGIDEDRAGPFSGLDRANLKRTIG